MKFWVGKQGQGCKKILMKTFIEKPLTEHKNFKILKFNIPVHYLNL